MEDRTITYTLTSARNTSPTSYNMSYTLQVPEYVIQQVSDPYSGYSRELRFQPPIAAPRENKSAEFFKQRQEEIDTFMDIVGCYIHGALYEAASYALAKLRRQEVGPSSAAEDLRHLLHTLGDLNFNDETAVSKTTQALCEALTSKPHPDREWSEIEEQLRLLAQTVRTTILELPCEQREEREAW